MASHLAYVAVKTLTEKPVMETLPSILDLLEYQVKQYMPPGRHIDILSNTNETAGKRTSGDTGHIQQKASGRRNKTGKGK